MSAHTKHIIGLLARVRIVSRGVDSYKHPLYSGTPQNNKIITCCTEFPHSIGALGNCDIMTKMRSIHTYRMSGCFYYSGSDKFVNLLYSQVNDFILVSRRRIQGCLLIEHRHY